MNLLQVCDPALVSKTTLTRKLTLDGVTKAYPVYRVRLDLLFYNDQNDRISTWITQYKNDPSNKAFSELSREEYNKVIEGFIIGSNPESISKTKNNISLVGQREPGVILFDGRIIDGNRRYTCLRLLNAVDESVQYFETVILDANIENNRKQIKMLELAIQYGEEQRVDYNLIDMVIGAYHDIVETKLLTVEEYVSSTNIPISDVRRRLETAALIVEFLEFMGVRGQYHIAREMQVYSTFYELVPLLRKCPTEEVKNEFKRSVFNNTMMGTFADQRKYLRDLKAMMDSGFFPAYIKKQMRIADEIEERMKDRPITNQEELREFVKGNEEFVEDFQVSMEQSLNQAKREKSKSMPSQIVSKSLSMIMDIDTRIFDKLSEDEKSKLKTQLHRLTDTVTLIEEEVAPGDSQKKVLEKSTPKRGGEPFSLARRHNDEPYVYCVQSRCITSLVFSLDFSAFKHNDEQADEATVLVYFVNEDYEELCSAQEICLRTGEISKVGFSLVSSASALKECFLVIQSTKDAPREVQQIIPCKMGITFTVDFDF